MARALGRAVLVLAVGLLLSGFGDGDRGVGHGPGLVSPWTYTAPGGAGCYWERYDHSHQIIANNFSAGFERQIVTVGSGDGGFATRGCGDWIAIDSSTVLRGDSNAPLPPGTWRVGPDVSGSNFWTASPASGRYCYWARLSDFSGKDNIIDNRFSTGPQQVRLFQSDVGFAASGDCGSWQRRRDFDPVGSLDGLSMAPNGIRARGWTFDPQIADSIDVHVYVDGAIAAVGTANGQRGDVGAAYPSYGSSHGYTIDAPAAPGPHTVCAYAINYDLGINSSLGCKQLTLPSTANPFGSLDVVWADGFNNVTLHGWTIDPNTAASVEVHTYVDGTLVDIRPAEGRRDDVAAAYPAFGPAHGLPGRIPMGSGPHTFCVYGINVGPGTTNTALGCRSLRLTGNPTGNLYSAHPNGAGRVQVQGWALDPDTSAAIDVHLYADGVWAGSISANGLSSEIYSLSPRHGPAHGFNQEVAIPHTARRVCAFAINVAWGTYNPQLGCVPITPWSP